MDIENSEFLLFLACAANSYLDFMLIGGFAVNFHGYNRTTHDMDIWLAPTNKNKTKFLKTLMCMGYTEDEVASMEGEDFTIPFKATIGDAANSIDCLTVVHHRLDYNKAAENKITFYPTPETICYVVPFDFLREMKILNHRPKDWSDVIALDEIRKKNGL